MKIKGEIRMREQVIERIEKEKLKIGRAHV